MVEWFGEVVRPMQQPIHWNVGICPILHPINFEFVPTIWIDKPFRYFLEAEENIFVWQQCECTDLETVGVVVNGVILLKLPVEFQLCFHGSLLFNTDKQNYVHEEKFGTRFILKAYAIRLKLLPLFGSILSKIHRRVIGKLISMTIRSCHKYRQSKSIQCVYFEQRTTKQIAYAIKFLICHIRADKSLDCFS